MGERKRKEGREKQNTNKEKADSGHRLARQVGVSVKTLGFTLVNHVEVPVSVEIQNSLNQNGPSPQGRTQTHSTSFFESTSVCFHSRQEQTSQEGLGLSSLTS